MLTIGERHGRILRKVQKSNIYRMTDIDLDSYKERQMKRRIDSLLRRIRVMEDYGSIQFLRTEPVESPGDFIDYITINVSEFFRNPEQWKYLEEEIASEVLKTGKAIRIWSAACSTGDEPYTISMILLKYMPRVRFSIVATDIDDLSLAAAREGVYISKSIKNVPEEFRGYFTEIKPDKFKIAPEIQKCVNFKKHNLLREEYPTNIDLLICRNVLIYFTEEKKEEIFEQFYRSLGRNGVFFLGNTEQMMDYRSIGYSRIASFFYGKE